METPAADVSSSVAGNGGPRSARCAHALVALVVVALAAALSWRQLHALRWHDIALAWRGIPPWRSGASMLLTAASFACLAQFEAWATRWAVPGRIPRRRAWRAGLLAHAVANTLGFHVLTAGAVRWRVYSVHGLSVADIARVVAVVGGCVACGVAAFALLALAAAPGAAADVRVRVALVAVAVAVGGMLVLGLRARRKGVSSVVAGHGLRVAALGLLEMGAASGALYVLLPPGCASPAWFALAFLGAMLAGLASHAPGGLGVFEATMLAALAPAPAAPVMAALLAYRAIYNLLPFLLALVVLGIAAWRRQAGLSSTVGSAGSGGVAGRTGAPARAR